MSQQADPLFSQVDKICGGCPAIAATERSPDTWDRSPDLV